ncbi:HMA2 domain-containing protein [Bacillus sp. OK048]|uniref:HMA2 domain-containing protein n=1 Tax=Bacillus sp. OK048 TaxID=1882761 RepID=UPI00088235FB|nr:hypothetical protein [Bacillus sp. OK048]SDN51334.1 hypothetical protein SAMN05443253_11327 [Bacillus sp. OK048]
MLGKVTVLLFLKHVRNKLSKYNINLVHFIQGRIRLQSDTWIVNKDLIHMIVKLMNRELFIYQVKFTRETGSLLITYDTAYLTTLDEMDSWFSILDEVYKKQYGSRKEG